MYGALMIDISGTKLTCADASILQAPEVGGVILFARNVETPSQVRALCDEIRQINHHIIIGVDQEGGRVARLRDGFTPLPAMGRLGKLFNHNPCDALALAYDCGYLMAVEVMAVGIDISFAPVLDRDDVSQVIGDRGFHKRNEAIVSLSSQFMRGMKDVGMATTAKHFPGHGSIAPDSHVADAIDSRSLDQIERQDLQPFKQCMPWLDAMMPAHVIYEQVDNKPAGFSKVWLQDIARKQLGFNGVLFSDDLSMKAAQVAGGIDARVTAALGAGCDMALVCNDRSAAIKAIEAASTLPMPNQDRLKAMRSHILPWLGSLQKTCQQYDYWDTAKSNVLEAFFDTSKGADCLAPHASNLKSSNLNGSNPSSYKDTDSKDIDSKESIIKDPTEYTRPS